MHVNTMRLEVPETWQGRCGPCCPRLRRRIKATPMGAHPQRSMFVTTLVSDHAMSGAGSTCAHSGHMHHRVLQSLTCHTPAGMSGSIPYSERFCDLTSGRQRKECMHKCSTYRLEAGCGSDRRGIVKNDTAKTTLDPCGGRKNSVMDTLARCCV